MVSGAITASSILMATWKKEPPGDGMVNKLSQISLAAGRDCSCLVMSTAAPATQPMPPYIMKHSWENDSASVIDDETMWWHQNRQVHKTCSTDVCLSVANWQAQLRLYICMQACRHAWACAFMHDDIYVCFLLQGVQQHTARHWGADSEWALLQACQPVDQSLCEALAAAAQCCQPFKSHHPHPFCIPWVHSSHSLQRQAFQLPGRLRHGTCLFNFT